MQHTYIHINIQHTYIRNIYIYIIIRTYIHTHIHNIYIHTYNQINSVGSPAGYAINAMGISSSAVSMPLFPSATATSLSPDIIRIISNSLSRNLYPALQQRSDCKTAPALSYVNPYRKRLYIKNIVKIHTYIHTYIHT